MIGGRLPAVKEEVVFTSCHRCFYFIFTRLNILALIAGGGKHSPYLKFNAVPVMPMARKTPLPSKCVASMTSTAGEPASPDPHVPLR